MLLDLLFLCLGLVGLYYGAEWLVGGSSSLALRVGISPLVIGLTVVAFGTSAPELAVCVQLNLAGAPDAAVGNVVGSNICNILLILGLSALMRPIEIQSQVIRREMPILIVVSVALVAMLWGGALNRLEGGILTVGIFAYVYLSFKLSRKIPSPEVQAEFAEEIGDPEEAKHMSPWKLFGLILAGLILLVIGAKLFQTGGVGIAQRLGVSEAVIGLTILAFGTSLPELATSIVASRKGEGDIIAGNAVGSSVFNILAILGITILVEPMVITQIEPVDLAVMVGSAVLGVVLMMNGRRLSRVEGTILTVAYLAYVALLVARGGAGI
jgi:cation:H+ antiporter